MAILALYCMLLWHHVEQPLLQLRTILLLVFGLVYLIRLVFMALYLLPREISAEELGFVMVFWVPGILTSLAVLSQPSPIHIPTAVVSIFLYIAGSCLNTGSELQRKLWKHTHPGQCYTEGLFSYSRNMNYFGNVVLFAGWALATSNTWNAWVPLTMAAMFYWFHIPTKERYLAERYGEAWKMYAQTTQSFVPFVC